MADALTMAANELNGLREAWRAEFGSSCWTPSKMYRRHFFDDKGFCKRCGGGRDELKPPRPSESLRKAHKYRLWRLQQIVNQGKPVESVQASQSG